VDLGLELRQRVQSRLAPAPVVIGCPVTGELLHRRQLHALRPIGDELPAGPARRIDATAQLVQILFRNVDAKRSDSSLGHGVVGHGGLRSVSWFHGVNSTRWPETRGRSHIMRLLTS